MYLLAASFANHPNVQASVYGMAVIQSVTLPLVTITQRSERA